MLQKPDLTIQENEAPTDLWCASGHVAPQMFSREGPGTPALPTRFFHISGKGINGVYCEACLAVANYVARKEKRDGLQ